jgi:hypothetical protein
MSKFEVTAMKRINIRLPHIACGLALAVAVAGSQSHGQTATDTSVPVSQLSPSVTFREGYPTPDSASTLNDELLYQRAVQSYLWALPVVNLMAMKEGSEKAFGAGYNVFPVWKERLNAKTQITTPNSDVIYAMTYVDVGTDGPLVIEVPPQQQGILDDFFQRPIAGPTIDGKAYAGDVGLPGPDKGKGGKFLVLPPRYTGAVPTGYYVYRSRTNNVFVFWRAFFKDPKDLSAPNQLIAQTRIYPLGKKADAKPMKFPDASGVPVNMLYARDSTFFDMLARFINSEPVDPADIDWRGMLAALGIVKGQPFNPDAHLRSILDAAAKTGAQMAQTMMYVNLEKRPGGLIYPDRRYIDPSRNNATDYNWVDNSGSFLDLDTRSGLYSIVYATSPAMMVPHPEQGARYVTAFKDADGDFLDGARSYQMHLPANIPAAIFWSVTVYDAATASGLDNGQPFPSINTMDKPETNADGSTDFYFGPQSPGAAKNYLATVPGKGYFVILRLYGPTKAYFDRTWKPDDITPIH